MAVIRGQTRGGISNETHGGGARVYLCGYPGGCRGLGGRARESRSREHREELHRRDVRLSAAEKQMLELHNKERASRDLPRLCVHPKLQKAANAHSRDMDPARPLHPRQRRPAPQEVRLPVARLRREHLPGRRPSLARDDLQGLDAKLLPQIKHPRPEVRRGRRRRRYRRRQPLENYHVDLDFGSSP